MHHPRQVYNPDKYGELPDYVAPDADRAWFRSTVGETRVANPHASVVAYGVPERGVPVWNVLCSSCGQVSTGVDKTWMELQRAEHEMAGRA